MKKIIFILIIFVMPFFYLTSLAFTTPSSNWLEGYVQPPRAGGAKGYPTEERLQAGKGLDEVRFDQRSGYANLVRGNPLTPPSQEEPLTVALTFIEEKKILWGIENLTQKLYLERSIAADYGVILHVGQKYNGIPVEAGFIIDINEEGSLTSISGEFYPDIDIDINPTITAEQALNTALLHADYYDNLVNYIDLPGLGLDNTPPESNPKLIIVPGVDKDYLLWSFQTNEICKWTFYVDAHNGVIRSAQRLVFFLDSPTTGTQSTPAHMEVDPLSLDFGSIEINEKSADKYILITNKGGADLTITDISINNDSFYEESYHNLPLILPSGASTSLIYSFSPKTSGNHESIVTITGDDDDNSLIEVYLYGKGINKIQKMYPPPWPWLMNPAYYPHSFLDQYHILTQKSSKYLLDYHSIYSLNLPYYTNNFPIYYNIIFSDAYHLPSFQGQFIPTNNN